MVAVAGKARGVLSNGRSETLVGALWPPVRASAQGRTSHSPWNKGCSERRQDQADSPYLGSPNVFRFCVCFLPRCVLGAKDF